MLNFNAARTLARNGYEMPAIMAAMNAAETAGSAELDGWIIRCDERGEMALLHPGYCGIWVGDFKSKVIFQRDISYKYSKYSFMNAKYRDLPDVLEKLNATKTNGYILCQCFACDYPRRKKQIEKLGYTVHRSNILACKDDTSNCVFLIA